MEDKKDEISNNKKIEDKGFWDWFDDHAIMVIVGFFLYFAICVRVLCVLVETNNRYSFGYFFSMVVGYALLLGILYMISKHLKQALMFMGIIVLLLLSVLLVKMIFFG